MQAFADPESEEANASLEKKKFALVPVGRKAGSTALALKAKKKIEPEWHAPWKMMRVISGHQGWVRALEVEPGNEWFASGASDSTIKVPSTLPNPSALSDCSTRFGTSLRVH